MEVAVRVVVAAEGDGRRRVVAAPVRLLRPVFGDWDAVGHARFTEIGQWNVVEEAVRRGEVGVSVGHRWRETARGDPVDGADKVRRKDRPRPCAVVEALPHECASLAAFALRLALVEGPENEVDAGACAQRLEVLEVSVWQECRESGASKEGARKRSEWGEKGAPSSRASKVRAT